MSLLYYLAGNFDGVDVGSGSGQVNVPNIAADNIFVGLLNGAYLLAGAVCVVIIIVGGFRYVISQGDSGSVAKAKNAILYAIVGLVIVAFAFVITQFVNYAVTTGL